MLDGYEVWLADDCGLQLELVARVEKSREDFWIVGSTGCCYDGAYNLALERHAIPKEAAALQVTPFKGNNSLLSGLQVPLRERTMTSTSATTTSKTSSSTTMTQTATTSSSTTTATSHTTTSSTYHTHSAVLRGCLGLSVSDADITRQPEAEAALIQAIQQVISEAAGPHVSPDHVEEVNLLEGEGCRGRRLARRLRATAVSADYVIIISPSSENDRLGGVEAVGTSVKANLEALTVNQAGSLLQTAMAGQPLLSTVDVSVTAVGSPTLDLTMTPYRFTQAFLATDVLQSKDEAGESEWMNPVSMTLVVLAALACLLALSWRFRHALSVKPPAPPQEPPSSTTVRVTISEKFSDPADVEDLMLSSEMAETRKSSRPPRPSWGNRSRLMTDPDDQKQANEMRLPPPPDQETASPPAWPELGPFDHADLESRDAPQCGSGIAMRGCCV